MDLRNEIESSQHDKLVLMMAQHFKQLGYSNITADITGWTKPNSIYWTNNPDKKFYPDLMCKDALGVLVILEAETCNNLNDEHTREQFRIFRAFANNENGRFEVVVPKICSGGSGRELITKYSNDWNIKFDNVWTPG